MSQAAISQASTWRSIGTSFDGKPHIGFGVYQSPGNTCEKSCLAAFKAGYRHIDSAMYYQNEPQVGAAVKSIVSSGSLKRHEIFVATKILSMPKSDIDSALKDGVARFGLDYVDLFMIHTPTMGPDNRIALWKGLERLQESGHTRFIGVSNFGVQHLEQLRQAGLSKPVSNQIEIHPWCQQRDVVDYCRQWGIAIEAYCPIVRGQKFDQVDVARIAKEVSRTPAQVLIRWSYQHNFIPLPKSDTPARIEANFQVTDFELSDAQMASLDALDEDAKGAIAPYNVRCP
ncbi:uncharacterized protein L969DRAFT_84307 [Mixia osmundae IAM 14324]|uniref:NADP-dependent oxidoreductase domain-containing protein n=1 Tax=Mixia osmundae (strain CBS 9802 / IAM 14324 / JCM 22182 / KY 12970) TaxID=764103 RepID=G7E377_MIXOS|nr:uncharacterized protein L969DRAFT_84307 [Mixia osmundae IAM 14324]KEI42453.1 hypothetical protein L969DRAFT_84307 [Mixia osmundae IAM 14324]GAA97258.1 hypothetical protein E5Q_03935 [Mixia osmundae IAM 14324]